MWHASAALAGSGLGAVGATSRGKLGAEAGGVPLTPPLQTSINSMWKRVKSGGRGLSRRLECGCGVGLLGSCCGTPLPSLGCGWDFPSIPRYFPLSRSLPTWPGTGVSIRTSYCSGSFPQRTPLLHLRVPVAVAGSNDRVVGSRRQLHDIKDRVKTSHQGREDQMVGILSDTSFNRVGA